MSERAHPPAVVTSKPRMMNAVSGMAAYHGTLACIIVIISCGRYRTVSRSGSCRAAEAWNARAGARHLGVCAVMELLDSNWPVGCRSSLAACIVQSCGVVDEFLNVGLPAEVRCRMELGPGSYDFRPGARHRHPTWTAVNALHIDSSMPVLLVSFL